MEEYMESKKSQEKVKKFGIKKKILVIAGAAILAIIAMIIALFNNDVERKVKTNKIYDSELARAMTYDRFVEGDENVEGTDNVKFSAFFLRDLDGDGYAEKIKGTCKQLGQEDTLYMEINVQTEGILKNAKIEVAGQNFYLVTASPKDKELKANYIGNNTKQIEFNDLNNGTQKLLTGLVRSGDYSSYNSKFNAIGKNLNNLSRNDNKIIFTGTYINGEGNEVEIRKEIDLAVDWYGKTRAELYADYTYNSKTYYDIASRIDEKNQKIKLTATIRTKETEEELNLSKNYVTGTIPELNGYAPIEVTSTLSDLEFNYDAGTREFKIEKVAEVSSENVVTKSIARSSTYTLNISYPLEAYTKMGEESVQIEIPVATYYEGFNNPNNEFKNPYKSNTATKTLIYYFREKMEDSVKYTNIDITVGKYIYNSRHSYIVSKEKPIKIYNGISSEEKDDNYTVRWSVSKGTNEVDDGLIIREIDSDGFIKTDSTRETMENLSTNVGIGFSNVDNFLNDDGFIKVYDDSTDELLVTFTKEDWGKYTQSNPYKYSLPVKNIRIETSKTKKEAGFYVYNIKELDDEYITENYTREEFDNLKYIESNLSVTAGEKSLGTDKHSAYYEAPYSYASINLSKDVLATQVTEKNEKITIKTSCDSSANQIAWKNGTFLIKLPDEILTTEINSVKIDNSSVSITSYEYIENEKGKFIKINTKNETPQTFNIVIDVNVSPDPKIGTKYVDVELWATNEEAGDYCYSESDIYDVNNNLNVDEKAYKLMTSISLVAPNTLLTNQTVSDYDESGTTVTSPQIVDFRPPVVKVDQEAEEKTAKIGVQLRNNYSSAISETVILGKIPFEGNTYVISGGDLQSSFTTKMVEGGLELPAELQGKVQVYYSENENPDRELTKVDNGWKLAGNIENWDNVKTFLIDFGDAEISAGEEYVFYYKIKIPSGIEYNKASYSHHGIYFALNTEQGKYRISTEPNKIGIRIAEKYNLEIQKYQKGKDVLVPGATYKITEENREGEITKTVVTNASGLAKLNKLYVEKVYRIEELKVPDDYELNSEIVRFIGHVSEDGSLTIETLEGTTREEIYAEKIENEDYKVIAKLEDEAKARLKVIKTEQGTETLLKGIRYKLSGESLPVGGKTITTNINGEISIRGLKIGTIYTLEEVKADGYYLANPIKFKIVNSEGIYSVEIIEGIAKENIIEEENNLPILTLKLEDEKKPTYNLELTKVKKIIPVGEGQESEETTYLAGAKFRLYKGTKSIGVFVTDENGKLVINNLYPYVNEKSGQETEEYTLREILAPEGYSRIKDIKFKVESIDGNLNFVEELAEGQTAKQYTIDGNTVKIVVEENSSFKIIKKDGETGEVLANTKFAIYNIDSEEVPARNSKGEIVGTKDTINGKEYYVVVTNSVGEITLDLPEGLYKAVEVEADEKYDISDSVYYFGIGVSREGKKELQTEWGKVIGETSGSGAGDCVKSVTKTSDGGYVIGGFFNSSIDLENGIVLTASKWNTGMIIKFDREENVEWGKIIDCEISSISETSDGGYIAGGCFEGSADLGNGIELNVPGRIIIKLDREGNTEWVQAIECEVITSVIETSDGGFVIGGSFKNSSMDLGNGIVLNCNGLKAGMIIKLDNEGTVEWGKAVGGIGETAEASVNSVCKTSDGGFVIGGSFINSSMDLGNGVVLNNNGYADGIILKLDREGNAKWGKVIGETDYDCINSVTETADGGYVIGGNFYSDSIDLGNGIKTNGPGGMIIKYDRLGNAECIKVIDGDINSISEIEDGEYIIGGAFNRTIDLENGVVLYNNSYSNKGMVIKFNEIEIPEIIVKQGKTIGETGDDYVKSVSETSDGGYIVGGYFNRSIDLGNGVVLNSYDSSYDGMIIKYDSEENIEWWKVIGGSYADYIESVCETLDGGYIVGGNLEGSIDLGNGIVLNSKSWKSGMVIKYDNEGNAEWGKVIGGSYADYIESVSQTVDGGYILGGSFSGSIDLENGIVLNCNGQKAGMIIKLDNEGNVEWGKAIGGIEENAEVSVNSVSETSDGGYAIGGYFHIETIDLGNGIILNDRSGWRMFAKWYDS